jgi:hypothetical protein
MCIYFIQAEQGGLIKIGRAYSTLSRLREIQLMCPVRLVVLGIIEGEGRETENELHDKFSSLRKYGEWFEPALSLLNYIQEYTTMPNIPEEKVFEQCNAHIRVNPNTRCSHPAKENGYCWQHNPQP